MAQKVTEIPRPEFAGGYSKYPWDDWLDGDIWEVIPGEDFDIKIDNFRTAVYQAAATRSRKATVRTSRGKVYIQASAPIPKEDVVAP